VPSRLLSRRPSGPRISSTGRPSSRLRRKGRARTSIRWSATTGRSWVCPRWVWSAGSCGQQSGLKPTDVQTAILYDHFTPFTLIQLEELGFCGQGEAKDFVADGAIEVGGRLPINTHGGQLGEAYIHGMNGIAEGSANCAAPRSTRSTTSNTCSSPPAPACRRLV
jgi:hypothetical protein